MLKSLLKRFNDHRLIDLGAQCAYFLLLSIFPFLIFIISLLHFLPFTFTDVYQLLEETFVPADVLDVIQNQWNILKENHRTGLLSLGLIFTLWTASLALDSILRALNLSYHISENRGFLLARLVSIFLTVGMFLVIIVALSLQVIGAHIESTFNLNLLILELEILRWAVSSIVIFAVFLLLYLVGPNLRLTLKKVYIGAIFATIGWQLTSYAFHFYLTNFANYSATYGTIGTVIALMVWFHISSLIILIGGEINAILYEEMPSQRGKTKKGVKKGV
ncbi:ribonuclease [Salipaludibacillus neizhouensis]|uniref:Ribonuclease n=1 Tax=Salipaludibacillus neizhouensis TaxID=885475 RepID=A0A3A9K1W4_9BACI|nr:YihY/virulence factor BrkB family protein [Salipaludibacillus neizhouensis]RKL66339.1 ribonuclease [Salipaludibacillus neizhouensis]